MANRFFQEDHEVHRRHRALNAMHTWLLVTGSLALLAITAWAIAGSTGILYALVFGGITLMFARRVSPAMVLKMYKAEPVNERNFPLGHRIITTLAERADLPSVPKLHVIPSNMLNAFAVGRKEDSAIAVTDSLVRALTARELAGVLAHEVTHIRNEDIKVMSLADMVSRFTSTLSTMGMLAILFNISGVFRLSWIAVIAMIAAPTIGGLLQMALSRTREFDADYGAALLTGDPDALSSALRKLEAFHQRRLEGMVLPTSRMPQPSMLRTHPPTDERVARLTALKDTLLARADGVVPDAEVADAPQAPRRASPVPRIPARFGREAANRHHARWAALAASAEPLPPVVSEIEADCISCEESLNPPKDRAPRVRLSRGGVWW